VRVCVCVYYVYYVQFYSKAIQKRTTSFLFAHKFVKAVLFYKHDPAEKLTVVAVVAHIIRVYFSVSVQMRKSHLRTR